MWVDTYRTGASQPPDVATATISLRIGHRTNYGRSCFIEQFQAPVYAAPASSVVPGGSLVLLEPEAL